MCLHCFLTFDILETGLLNFRVHPIRVASHAYMLHQTAVMIALETCALETCAARLASSSS